MSVKESRPGAGTPERPTEGKPLLHARSLPQLQDNTADAIGQEEMRLDYETECKIVKILLAPYNRACYRNLPRVAKERVYLRGRQRFVGLDISQDAKSYGYKLLSQYLRK